MEIMDAISLTISSMLIVFLTLFLIAMVLQSFTVIFKEKPKPISTNSIDNNLDITEEEKTVVAIMASILMSEDKENPNLYIKSIKRIK